MPLQGVVISRYSKFLSKSPAVAGFIVYSIVVILTT